MCMLDYSDGCVTSLGDVWRKAKKDHKCRECYRVIHAGERYHYETFKWDGAFHTHATCEHCNVVRDWLSDECGGWLYGGVREDINEHVFEGYPKSVIRLAVGMNWKWVAPSGRMLPVPRRPATTDERLSAARGAT